MAEYKVSIDENNFVLQDTLFGTSRLCSVCQLDESGVKHGLAVNYIDSTFGLKAAKHKIVPLYVGVFLNGKPADMVYYFDYNYPYSRLLDQRVKPVGKLVCVCVDGEYKTDKDLDRFEIEGNFFYTKAVQLLQNLFKEQHKDIVYECLGITDNHIVACKDHFQLDNDLWNACRTKNKEAVQKAVRSGADINARQLIGRTPLMSACFHGDIKMAKLLIDLGASLESKDFSEGQNALMLACRNGYTKTAKMLVDNGANLESKDNDGWTGLMLACVCGHTGTVKMLVDNGADIYAKNNEGETALMQAQNKKYAGIVKILVSAMREK